MLKKIAGLAALTLAGAALFVPDATFARGGIGGGIGGFHGGFRGPAILHRAPFMARTGTGAFGRNGAAFRGTQGTVPRHLPEHPIAPAHIHLGKPFAHLFRRDHHHHRHSVSGWLYPFTTWDDGSYAGSYIGVPYDPGAAIPVYGPGPAIDPAFDAPLPIPRIGMRDNGGDACSAERVTVPTEKDDREITIVRC
jgi:hypothetical protein